MLTTPAQTITATGSATAATHTPNPRGPDTRAVVGVSGTFASCVLTFEGKLQGGSVWYPLSVLDRSTLAKTNGTASPTDSTAASYLVDIQGIAALRVYPASGTPTSLVVEIASGTAAEFEPSQTVVTLAASVAQTVTSASATALAVGLAGATNPALLVDASTASSATGVKVKSAAAAGGVAVTTISSGTNENLTVDAKGSGTITLGGTSTGNVVVGASKLTVAPATGNTTSAGSILSTSATGGIGYATGAGGAVTQTTNRSTGVTINTPTGAITTDTTSLAAGAEAEFTVTNSSVAATDVVVVSLKSGNTGVATCVPVVTAVAAGSFKICITNLHASTAETGACVLNYAVIKGVAA